MYKVILTHKSSIFVKNLPKFNKKKLDIIIDRLKENPYSYPYKKIKGETNLYRIRIGGFRISYEIYENENIINILKIGKRDKFYQ
ncbi:MAG TPA: type II toxin-antitoxin system RelE/ParE family toxin [Methanofastidiosum sp.]|nr:type II toxin-antitoxin system RelE/ParE family toxin [Methanofastidiosum sp.]